MILLSYLLAAVTFVHCIVGLYSIGTLKHHMDLAYIWTCVNYILNLLRSIERGHS